MNCSIRCAFGRAVSRFSVVVLMTLEAVLSAQTNSPSAAELKDKNKEKEAVDAAPSKLEAFTVTGSHIARVDYETPAPVLVLTAAEIDAKGYTTLGEFVSTLSFNNNQTNSEVTTSSFVTGTGTSNPRGLGSNRFLTLINGRRGVPFALTNGINGTPVSVFNFNSIPSSAVERIEFLKDGASAIYGSDAITGVYNIIFKKNYSGNDLDISVSNSPHHDMLNRRASLSTGFTKDGWSIFASASHRQQHSSYTQDYGTKSSFFSYMGARGVDQFSTVNLPSYVTFTAAQAATAGLPSAGVYVIPNAVATANPKKSDFVFVGAGTAQIPVTNRFDFGPTTQQQPDIEQYSGYASIEKKLKNDLTVFGQVTFSRGKTYSNFGPYGYSTNLNGLTLPATNPYNPFGVNLTAGAATPVAFTLRTIGTDQHRQTRNSTASFLAGLRGSVLKDWKWESAVNYGVDRSIRFTEYLPSAALSGILAGTTRATAYNPFGPSENPNIVRGIQVFLPERNNIVDSFSYDLSASGTLWQIPLRDAGAVGVATGYEFREESLRGHPDTSTTYIGFTPNLTFHGRRHVNSVYAEVSLPLKKWLEVQLAGRHEYYSDFGHTTKPKISAKLNLPKNKVVNVLVRGSYSESFKAPDIAQTRQARTIASTTLSIDPFRPGDGARTVRVIQGGNPNLEPEQGKIQFVGVVLEFPSIPGLSLTAEYFDHKINAAILTLTQSFLLSADGLKQFPNAIRRGPNLVGDQPGWLGPVIEYDGISQNLGYQLSQTWDFGARYRFRTERYGAFSVSADLTQLVKRGSDSGLGAGFANVTGRYNAPIWRGNYGLTWRYRDFNASVTSDVIGKFFNNGFTSAQFGENVYAIVNTSVSYRGFKKTTITIGANNALNHRPPQNGLAGSGFGYDERSVTAIGGNGILLNARVRREF